MILRTQADNLLSRLLACLAAAAIAVTARADTDKPLDIPAAVAADEARRIEVMDRAKDVVVAVFSPSGEGGGSGVVISPDGFALTNFHVVQPCGNWMRCGMADGNVYNAVLVGIDPVGDVALIKLFPRQDDESSEESRQQAVGLGADFPTAEMADSDRVRPGDACFAMGNPFMLAADFQPTATWGIISGTHRYQYPAGTLLEYTDCLQTDASINPGNSGGPLFDARGRLIGINGRASFEKRGRVNVGIAYAISINQIKHFLGHLHSGRIVDHATLGATVAFDAEGNVVVSDILEQSDAYRRGLRYDDEIVRFAGRPIHTPNMLKNVLGIYPRGWRLPLVYRRDGREREILVRLRGAHNRDALIEKLQKPSKKRLLPPDDAPPDRDKPGGKPPDDKPSRNKPDEVPSGDDNAPAPDGIPLPKKMLDRLMKKPPPMPEVIADHFEKRRGYANYFVNRRHRERLLDAWQRDPTAVADRPVWTAEGTLAAGGEFRLTVDDAGCRLTLPRTEFTWRADRAWLESLGPPQSGGLFPALYLWRQMATGQIDVLDEVYYLGKAPLVDPSEQAGSSVTVSGLAEVLVVRHRGVDAHLYFQADDGRLLAMELFGGGEDDDPCELYLIDNVNDDADEEGGPLPRSLVARYGDAPYATFNVDRWRFDEEVAEAAPAALPPTPGVQP